MSNDRDSHFNFFYFLAVFNDYLNFLAKEPSGNIPKPGTGERTFREHSAQPQSKKI
jgi:hypothetical protein